MKLTLANIKEIKRKSESPLKRRVCNYVIECWSEYSDKSGIFTDVLSGNSSITRTRCAFTNSTVLKSMSFYMTR